MAPGVTRYRNGGWVDLYILVFREHAIHIKSLFIYYAFIMARISPGVAWLSVTVLYRILLYKLII